MLQYIHFSRCFSIKDLGPDLRQNNEKCGNIYTICPREFGTSLEVNLGELLARDLFETSAPRVSMYGQLKFKIWGQSSKKCGFFSNG